MTGFAITFGSFEGAFFTGTTAAGLLGAFCRIFSGALGGTDLDDTRVTGLATSLGFGASFLTGVGGLAFRTRVLLRSGMGGDGALAALRFGSSLLTGGEGMGAITEFYFLTGDGDATFALTTDFLATA